MDHIALADKLLVDRPVFGIASANRPEGAGKIHDEISSSTFTPLAASLYGLANPDALRRYPGGYAIEKEWV